MPIQQSIVSPHQLNLIHRKICHTSLSLNWHSDRQLCANRPPIHGHPVRTSRIELRERVLCGPTTLKTPSFSELLSRVTTMSIHGHFCKSNKNPSPICTSMINPLPIQQSNLNRTIQRQLCPIHGQSLTNLQIQCQHLTINQSVNPIPCKSTDNHRPIQPQSLTDPPIHRQAMSTGPNQQTYSTFSPLKFSALISKKDHCHINWRRAFHSCVNQCQSRVNLYGHFAKTWGN